MAWAYLVAASIAGYTCYTWLLGHAPLSLTATYAYVNPVVAVTLGAVFLDEDLSVPILIGFVLVLSGCWLATRPAGRFEFTFTPRPIFYSSSG